MRHPTPEEMEKGRKRTIEEGIASQAMESLTTGVFLVGIALHFGASNFVIGLLGAIPFLSNLFQIPAIHIVEKHRDRKKVVVITSLIARTFLLCVAIAPFFTDSNIALTLIIGGMAMRYCIGAMSTCAWNSWVRDLIPEKGVGAFLGMRLYYKMAAATLLSIVAAYFIDWWGSNHSDNQVFSYSIIYLLGFFAAMISTAMIRTIPHPPMSAPEAHDYERSFTYRYLKRPLRHENFRSLIIFLMLWNFAVNLAAPFFTVYMLKNLQYDMTFVIILTMVSSVVHTFTLKLWGKYSDLYSNKTVLAISGTVFVFCLLGWTFVTFPDKHILTMPLVILLHILMGGSTAGVVLASSSIALKLSPQKEATAFLAMKSMMTSFAAGIAPLFGGLFADYFENKTLSIDFNWQSDAQDKIFQTLNLHHWDFFFILAFLVGLYSLRTLRKVQEEGAVHGKVAVRAMMIDTTRALKTISTVAGLRDLTMYPMKIMANVVRRKSKKTK